MPIEKNNTDLVFEGGEELKKVLKEYQNIMNQKEMFQVMIDSAVILERDIKEELRITIYNKPETWYNRRMGAGLFGATQASGKVKKGTNDSLITGVISAEDFAKYIFFGTGIFASDGRGRKTAWVYPDGKGGFHFTIGRKPNPYMTKGGQKALPKILKFYAKSIPPVLEGTKKIK